MDLNQDQISELVFDEILTFVTQVKSYLSHVYNDEILKDMEDVNEIFRKDEEEQSKNDNIGKGKDKSICIVRTSIKIASQQK